jgi:hypothetical protein
MSARILSSRPGWWLVLVSLLLLAGCKKDPSPAQLALENFALTVAQGHPTDALVIGEEKVEFDTSGGEPTEGSINALAPINIGTVDWARSTLEQEVKLASGDRQVQLLWNLCLRAENQAQCLRPSQYRYRGLMRLEDGVWKVAGSSCEVVFEVR